MTGPQHHPPSPAGPVLLMVRFKPGVVGETRRVLHLVPAPAMDGRPLKFATLTAFCGQ